MIIIRYMYIIDDPPGSVTPGIISLDALFRTASLQQGTGTQIPTSVSQQAPVDR